MAIFDGDDRETSLFRVPGDARRWSRGERASKRSELQPCLLCRDECYPAELERNRGYCSSCVGIALAARPSLMLSKEFVMMVLLIAGACTCLGFGLSLLDQIATIQR